MGERGNVEFFHDFDQCAEVEEGCVHNGETEDKNTN